MAQLISLSVYEINGNPGSVPVGPKNYLFAPANLLKVTPYTGPQIYRCYSYVYTSDGEQFGVSENQTTIAQRANA